MERIGVRELRQHASRYLARVARGEVIEVTDRSRPVAWLVPVETDKWSDLIASGVVREPVATGDVLDVRPVRLDSDASDASDAVDASDELEQTRVAER